MPLPSCAHPLDAPCRARRCRRLTPIPPADVPDPGQLDPAAGRLVRAPRRPAHAALGRRGPQPVRRRADRGARRERPPAGRKHPGPASRAGPPRRALLGRDRLHGRRAARLVVRLRSSAASKPAGAMAYPADLAPHRYLPPNEPIDLLNVAFENPRALANAAAEALKSGRKKRAQVTAGPEPDGAADQPAESEEQRLARIYDVPDRLTGREAVAELCVRNVVRLLPAQYDADPLPRPAPGAACDQTVSGGSSRSTSRTRCARSSLLGSRRGPLADPSPLAGVSTRDAARPRPDDPVQHCDGPGAAIPHPGTRSAESGATDVLRPPQSLALALYFASRGSGCLREDGTTRPYASRAKVLLTGLGADECVCFTGWRSSANAR